MVAKSPPSQHEQISDLSQVIRSVCEELEKIQKGNWFKFKNFSKFFFKNNLFLLLVSGINFLSLCPDLMQQKRQTVRSVLQTQAALQLSLHDISLRQSRQNVSHLKPAENKITP